MRTAWTGLLRIISARINGMVLFLNMLSNFYQSTDKSYKHLILAFVHILYIKLGKNGMLLHY